jgi:hypothetical protein
VGIPNAKCLALKLISRVSGHRTSHTDREPGGVDREGSVRRV